MSPAINPLLPSLSLPSTDNLSVLQIKDTSPELAKLLKKGMLAQLEIFPSENGVSKALLQINGQSFNILLLSGQPMSSLNESKVFSVRVGAGGQLFPIKTETSEASPPLIKEINPDVLKQIDVRPVKVDAYIEKALKDLNILPPLRQRATAVAPQLEVSLASVGNIENENNKMVLQQLQTALQEKVQSFQNISKIENVLKQVFENVAGQKISGSIIGRINDMTRIQTPLGETFFVSKIKLPPAETVLLNINGIIPVSEQKISILDGLLRSFLPENNISAGKDILTTLPLFKNLEAIGKLSPDIFAAVAARLPLQKDNLLNNIYNFYQAALHKDLSRWLKTDMAKIQGFDPPIRRHIIEELNNFVVSALKETVSWRVVEMPLFDGNQFTPLKIAVKKDEKKQKEDSKKKQNGTRFIVETEFSKLGSFQFDGFANAQKRQFDLIIRTSNALDDDFCSHIINLFKKSLYDLDYAGTVKINRQESFVIFQEENTISKGIYV